MSGALILVLGALKVLALQNHSYTRDDVYRPLPRFWTSTGFCPPGAIGSPELRQSLLSDEVLMNLRHLASLPAGAVTHVRIHWLLELIDFKAFTQAGVPIYDFTNLDTFISNLDDLGLYPVVEFMANPGNVFVKNPNRNDFYWEDLSYQVTKHYLNTLGAGKVLHWRYESWNEPDLKNYNRLNFTVNDYLSYLMSLRRGLDAAGSRPTNSLHFPLRGPAGLFKAESKHPLCWGVLEYCNENIDKCPLEVLTYHRKGDGTAGQVMSYSTGLLSDIFRKYPKLKETLSVSNDEADPISGWSTPRDMQADVRYAYTLTLIVMEHWSAMFEGKEFEKFESLSHDNAFLSYHPYEFSQRTLLAHFRMNDSQPVYSQFIRKPVYSALGILGRLAPLAADLAHLTTKSGESLFVLKTTVADNNPLFLSWLLLPSYDVTNSSSKHQTIDVKTILPFELCADETYGFIVEFLEQERTDPAWVWRMFDSPPFPNATVRESLRRSQSPIVHSTGLLTEAVFKMKVELKLPWIMLYRVCSNLVPIPKQPQQLLVTEITKGEVLLTWREVPQTANCLKSYEVWFKAKKTSEWTPISSGWHIPYPSFHYAPKDMLVNGFYKVRACDIFNRSSPYSEAYEYIEL